MGTLAPICPWIPVTVTLSHEGERGRSIVGRNEWVPGPPHTNPLPRWGSVGEECGTL